MSSPGGLTLLQQEAVKLGRPSKPFHQAREMDAAIGALKRASTAEGEQTRHRSVEARLHGRGRADPPPLG